MFAQLKILISSLLVFLPILKTSPYLCRRLLDLLCCRISFGQISVIATAHFSPRKLSLQRLSRFLRVFFSAHSSDGSIIQQSKKPTQCGKVQFPSSSAIIGVLLLTSPNKSSGWTFTFISLYPMGSNSACTFLYTCLQTSTGQPMIRPSL